MDTNKNDLIIPGKMSDDEVESAIDAILKKLVNFEIESQIEEAKAKSNVSSI